jgi:hypothetical protein
MTTWRRAARDALISGSAASVASTSALIACGALETGSTVAPINSISHWYWGERAAHRDNVSFRHTALGYITHHAAAVFWAVVHEKIFRRRRRAEFGVRDLSNAATTAAIACFVDYQLTPRRLTPGYEKRLSRKSLVVVYGMFALGLALGDALIARSNKR